MEGGELKGHYGVLRVYAGLVLRKKRRYRFSKNTREVVHYSVLESVPDPQVAS